MALVIMPDLRDYAPRNFPANSLGKVIHTHVLDPNSNVKSIYDGMIVKKMADRRFCILKRPSNALMDEVLAEDDFWNAALTIREYKPEQLSYATDSKPKVMKKLSEFIQGEIGILHGKYVARNSTNMIDIETASELTYTPTIEAELVPAGTEFTLTCKDGKLVLKPAKEEAPVPLYSLSSMPNNSIGVLKGILFKKIAENTIVMLNGNTAITIDLQSENFPLVDQKCLYFKEEPKVFKKFIDMQDGEIGIHKGVTFVKYRTMGWVGEMEMKDIEIVPVGTKITVS